MNISGVQKVGSGVRCGTPVARTKLDAQSALLPQLRTDLVWTDET